MDIKRIYVYWFSGTGNTLNAVRTFCASMKQKNISVIRKPIPGNFLRPEEGDMLVFMMPVYSFGIPVFIWEWLEEMPAVKTGNPVVVVTTKAGVSGLVKEPLRNLLESKGLTPYGIDELIMPSNIFYVADELTNVETTAAAKNEISKFADNCIDGATQWKHKNFFVNIAYGFLRPFIKYSYGITGSMFFAQSHKCRGCGECVRFCPTANITMQDAASVPVWGWRCTQCLKCYNFCPHNAVTSHLAPLIYPKYRAPGVNLKDISPAYSQED